MARGKHANAAEARRAREQAVADAARLRKENEKLVAANTELSDRVADLTHQVAEGKRGD